MKKILIVIDMQKDFIDGSLGTKEAVSIVPNVCEKIKNFEGKIFITKDTHSDDYLQTSEGKKLPVEHCIKGTDGWQIDSDVEKVLSNKDYIVVEKPTFGSLELPRLIKGSVGDDDFEIELVGLCTDICVVSNALILKACYPEISIKVDPLCCAGVTVNTHNAAIETMKMCQIDII